MNKFKHNAMRQIGDSCVEKERLDGVVEIFTQQLRVNNYFYIVIS
jgi:hypothetical protein